MKFDCLHRNIGQLQITRQFWSCIPTLLLFFVMICCFLPERVEAQIILDQPQAKLFAQQKGWIVKGVTPNKREFELQRIINGMPMYYITNNLNAADSVSTDECWPGGSSGLNLSGTGVKLGIWDAGKVRNTHIELTSRVTQQDGASSLSSHATHVSGTMIGTGVFPDSPPEKTRGMSFVGTLDAHDWNSDESEMNIAAGNGLLVSNHSYGLISGWVFGNFGAGNGWYWWGDVNVSTVYDYNFGFYDIQANQWDTIAFQHPFYLIVKAAGNDRNEGPGPGTPHFVFIGGAWTASAAVRSVDGDNGTGFDSISHAGISKNILTVGAVRDVIGGYSSPASVSMSSFSSWGPADDGRIKPDIVANGVFLFSSTAGNDQAYSSFSGTSMSAPNTSGSLGLLIENYRTTHSGADMKAATLKGLVIHTADETGSNPGPDYTFGWGLLNTLSAAQHISLDATNPGLIQELTIPQGQTISQTWTYTGSGPVIATISWTDPPAIPPSPALDPPDKMLINDLDLRIIDPNTNTHQPWMLNPLSPASAASTGDNISDNVEVVYISAPVSGDYTFQITHKGTLLHGLQNFSLILTGVNANGPFFGACCEGETCTGTVTQSPCNGVSGTWYAAADCSTFTCPPQGACCVGCSTESTCMFDKTQTECAALTGVWTEGISCDVTDCTLVNDDCVSGILEITDGIYPFDNRCSTTDGPGGIACELTNDLWFSYSATCSGVMTASTCVGTLFDGMIAVFTNNDNACPCPTNNATRMGSCEDDNCGLGGGPSTIERNVIEGRCYTIRLGGWSGSLGSGILDISCEPSTPPDPVLPDSDSPGGLACGGGPNYGLPCSTCSAGMRVGELCNDTDDCEGNACEPDDLLCPDATCGSNVAGGMINNPWPKNRYIGFMPPNTDSWIGAEIAIRVTLVDVPSNPNCNGEIRWAGVPAEFSESSGSEDKFQASKLGTEPVFVDWNAIGNPIQIYGEEINPGSLYSIQAIDIGRAAALDFETNYSNGLLVKTAVWGDVIKPVGAIVGPGQPNIDDVLALVGKWLSQLKPLKAISQLQLGVLTPADDLTVDDVLIGVNAWLGSPYPFSVSSCP